MDGENYAFLTNSVAFAYGQLYIRDIMGHLSGEANPASDSFSRLKLVR
jgi:hypothetical protein